MRKTKYIWNGLENFDIKNIDGKLCVDNNYAKNIF
jgi:hypothetical protein